MYEYTDRVIAYQNRKMMEIFHRYSQTDFDETHLLETGKKLFDDLNALFRKCLLMVANKYYTAKKRKMTAVWLMLYLREVDPVTRYAYRSEWKRKRDRFIEQMMSAKTDREREKAVTDAERYWSRMFGEYAVRITDEARTQSMADKGVEMVRWYSQKDDRVCEICEERDGNVYRVDAIPDKAHWNCRCYWRPVR